MKKFLMEFLLDYLSNHTMIEICELLSLVGFKELVSEKINYKIHYNHVLDLLKDIKGTGENNLLTKRKKGLMTMNYINELNRQYKRNFGNRRWIISYLRCCFN